MPPAQPLRAAIWMTGAIISFSAMAVAGRELASGLDTYEIMLYRSAIGLVVVVLVARVAGTLGQVSPRSIHVHFIRNIAHFTGQNLWFFALGLIPLAQVFALEFTAPIWAMFLAVLVLGESLTKIRLTTAVLGFAGVLIITQPWGAPLSLGIIAAALAAIGFAGTAVFTRLLTRSETVTCILFWLVSMQLVFSLICAGYDGDITWPGAQAWPLIVLVSLAGLVAHFCITKALSLAPAAVVMPVDFTRLPLIALVGYLFYSEDLSIALVIGSTMIIGANYLSLSATSKK